MAEPIAPSEELQNEMRNALYYVQEGDAEQLKQEIAARTLEQLEALAYLIKKTPEVTPTPEIKNALKERAEVFLQTMQVDQRLQLLNTRLTLLIELVPTLKPAPAEKPGGIMEKGQYYAQKAGEYITFALNELKKVKGFGWVGDVQEWVGDTAPKVGEFLWYWGQRGFYSLLSTPSLLGVNENTPGIGNVVAWAKNNLTALNNRDFIEAMREVVSKERGQGVFITFDESLSSSVLEGLLKAHEDLQVQGARQEKIKELAEAYIKAEKEAGKGTQKNRIVLSAGHLLRLDAAKKRAEQTKQEREKVATQELASKAKEAWKVEAVEFGETVSTKKEGGKWKLTLVRGEIGEDGKPKGGTKAERLQEAMKDFSSATSIALGERVEVQRGGKIVLPPTGVLDVDSLNKLLEQSLFNVLRPGEKQLAFGPADVRVTDGAATLEWKDAGALRLVAAHWQQLAQVLQVQPARDNDLWVWKDNKWQKQTVSGGS